MTIYPIVLYIFTVYIFIFFNSFVIILFDYLYLYFQFEYLNEESYSRPCLYFVLKRVYHRNNVSSFPYTASSKSLVMKALELYSGIGGMHYALCESGIAAKVVAAIDINTVANDVYCHNFPETALLNRNIQSIDAQELNKLNVDIILMSPPCQPFTRLGLKKDALDNRTDSLLHILNLIPELKELRYILLENVKGFETSQMRDKLVDCLESCGYVYRELILSPCQFGIPNSRHRYYLLAKKNNLKFRFKQPSLESDLLPELCELLPKSKHSELAEKKGKINPKSGRLCYTLSKVLENTGESKYLVPSELLQKRAWILDIRTSESNGSCCFTKGYGRYAEGTGSVYCPFTDEAVRLKYDEVASHKNNSVKQMQILSDLKLRFFSPKEVCRLMCFPEDFQFPEHITDRQKYRLLGNSINIHVVSRLILLLYTENEDT